MLTTLIVAAMAAAGPPQAAAAPVPAAPPAETPSAGGIVLPRDTPVQLMAIAEVTTAKATPGTRFKLRVNRAIEVDGRMLVPVGTLAYGEVITARDSGGLGKSGVMTARLLHIQLGDVAIPLDGDISAKGTGAGSAGVAVVFTGLVGLFHRGNNAKIKAGEIINAFTAQDATLPALPAPAPPTTVAASVP